MDKFEDRLLLAVTVNTAMDYSDGSIIDGTVTLRDAILRSVSGETIDFVPALNGATIYLQESLKEIAFSKSLTIDASMLANGITIDGNNSMLEPAEKHRIFNITAPTPNSPTLVTMKNLKLTGGNAGRNSDYVGGAIRSHVSLTLEECSIDNNHAGEAGGGIYFAGGSGGALTLKSTHISGNSSVGKGGGLYVSASDATVRFENSTVSGNTSDFTGGGMYVESNHTIFEIENSTIIDNTGTGGGGGVVLIADQGTIGIKNSTISDNKALSSQGFAAGLHM